MDEDHDTKDDYRDKLYSALKSVKRPGSFCVSGTIDQNPGLELDGLGQISLPLSSEQAEQLATLCVPAPFERKDETIHDEKIRNCLQLSPEQFKLSTAWEAEVRRLAGSEVRYNVGIRGYDNKVEPRLYKLLIYKTGGHFAPHRDTAKEDGMFGTLAVVLPSAHTGGELIVRQDGETFRFDSAREDPKKIHYAAFYADCQHEVLPVRSGYRLVLVYNLVTHKSSDHAHLEPSSLSTDSVRAVREIVEAIREWSQDASGPQKMAFLLKHQYSRQDLEWGVSGLKDHDRVTVELLSQAMKACGAPAFHANLGMLQKYERGKDWHRHKQRHWRRKDKYSYSGYSDGESDESSCEVEVHDYFPHRLSLLLEELTPLDEEEPCCESMQVEKKELVPEGALNGCPWDEVNVFQYTGNDGTIEDRWYHHALIVIWPHTSTGKSRPRTTQKERLK